MRMPPPVSISSLLCHEHCQRIVTIGVQTAFRIEKWSPAMFFQIVRLELNESEQVIARKPLKPLFELRDDAMALAEFDAGRCDGEFGYDVERDCWWAHDAGHTFRFIVEKVEIDQTWRPETIGSCRSFV
jgi:hypothetical protein